MNEDLLPIGRFARLTRLSVKRLRHYAETGLLLPAWIDPDTGYRYYRADQARDALAIGLLRSLDVPLAAIGPVLSGGERAGEVLSRVGADLEAELDRRRRTLATLRRVLSEGLPAADVVTVTEPPQRVWLARGVAPRPEDIGKVTTELVATLVPPGMPPPAGPLTGLFPADIGESVPITLARPESWDGEPPPRTEPGVLPGGVFACATHIGPYQHVSLTAHALFAWCATRGHQGTGPVREVYLSDPAVTEPGRLITRIMIELEDT
ncbi:GyrI-like domain-containing protein [Spongiactinospora sp. TRM90649]|uniref:MerR family transcriptional regulator n=1 Tax=Spongiactinospora sp. TRM90649 TaxID=3031114 RepID=UPI0023F98149|nr:GyrI-like domain-containing protein [Spongiactinospora sp. TRM90649]